jgi:hypothetical protein
MWLQVFSGAPIVIREGKPCGFIIMSGHIPSSVKGISCANSRNRLLGLNVFWSAQSFVLFYTLNKAHLLIDDEPADPFLTVTRAKFVAQLRSPRIAQQCLDDHIGFVI